MQLVSADREFHDSLVDVLRAVAATVHLDQRTVLILHRVSFIV